MKSIFLYFALCVTYLCHAEFTDHLRKITEERTKNSSIKNIDFIYLINLDQRPEKLEKCTAQLNSYHIPFQRFPAIYGWSLSAETLNDIGVKFSKEMLSDQWAVHFPVHGDGTPENDFLREECYGKTFFSQWMTPGAIGCTLSHLSVLQDAYDAGYETIWVMEDDILIERDPALLSSLIKKLDQLVGIDGWDILYTDLDTSDGPSYTEANDFESDLKGNLWFFWRPDIDLTDRSIFAKRTILSEDFIKIGSRMRTHSMIIRRSGMKKILDFEKSHHIFIPYDHELAAVPNIQMISLRYNLVTHAPSLSDTQTGQFVQRPNNWEKYKQETLNELPSILGWYEPVKAEKVMEFMREAQPKTCVEIGAFGGAMTFPIARTLLFLKQGTMAAIDAWDAIAAADGLEDPKSVQWWKNINMDVIHQKFLELISKKMLNPCCVPIRNRSQDAVALFADESIDFLYIDGNNSRSGSLQDVMLYLPKVKTGGFIWLNNADLLEKNRAVAYLMANCKWIKEKSLGINFILFQKKER